LRDRHRDESGRNVGGKKEEIREKRHKRGHAGVYYSSTNPQDNAKNDKNGRVKRTDASRGKRVVA